MPGRRPGKQTADYIDSVMTRLALFGGLYLGLVSVLPDILVKTLHMNLLFGGTSLLIMVVVVIELMAQLRAHMVPNSAQIIASKAQHGAGRGRILSAFR